MPQSGVHTPPRHELHAPQPQSAAQLLQSSQVGLQVPSPQADATHVPFSQFCVQGTHPQSPGQVLQSSQAGSQTPFPQVDWHTPATQVCAHGVHPQSAAQVPQSSPQSHNPLPDDPLLPQWL